MLSSDVLGTAMTADPVSCVAGRTTSVWNPTSAAIFSVSAPTGVFGMAIAPNISFGMPSISISS